MKVNLNPGDTIVINNQEYELVEGDDFGCENCDLYELKDYKKECIIECGSGHLECAFPDAIITCPNCTQRYYQVVEKNIVKCITCHTVYKVRI
jgi:hypothetical protein